MAVSKHNLTKIKDDIEGSGGVDLFIAPLKNGHATLSNVDVLDGKAGIDRLVATITETSLRPNAKNIEIGDFTFDVFSFATLNLGSAHAMGEIVLSNAPDLVIKNAGDLSRLSLLEMQDDIEISLENLDTKSVRNLSVTVGHSTGLEISIDKLNKGPVLNRLDLTLNNSDVLIHPLANARTVALHSHGAKTNYATFSDFAVDNGIRHIVIDGAAAMTFDSHPGFGVLASIDASKATGMVSGELDSPGLLLYQGSRGKDVLELKQLGGDSAASQKQSTDVDAVSDGRTHLNLGNGADVIDAASYALNGKAVDINGGAGFDTITLDHSINNSADMFHNVERLVVNQASGIFYLHDSGVRQFTFLDGAQGTTSLVNIQSVARLWFGTSQDEAISVVVEGAKKLKTDTLLVDLTAPTAQDASGSMVIGSFSNGITAIGLSHLEIDSNSLGSSFLNWLALGSVGNAANQVSITVSGDHHLFLFSTDTAKSYIQKILIENTGGVDLSGLTRGIQSFDPDGVTIVGGSADDVLVGGTGNDVMRTGGGDNIAIGSLGSDEIYLKKSSGADRITYSDIDETSTLASARDKIHNFAPADVFDLGNLVASIQFVGNYDSFIAGDAALDASEASAFFVRTEHVLYIDVNHDTIIEATHDLSVKLVDVNQLGQFNFIV